MFVQRSQQLPWTVTHHGGVESCGGHTRGCHGRKRKAGSNPAPPSASGGRRDPHLSAAGPGRGGRPMQSKLDNHGSRVHCHVTDLLDEYGHPDARSTLTSVM